MTATPPRAWTLCGVALLCLGGAAMIARSGESVCAASPRGDELLYFPSGRLLRQAALGHEAFLADIGWLRAVQYYGEHRRTDRRYPLMRHVFDVVTGLDPRFVNAYAFGGLVLAQDAGDLDAGVALLSKGIANNPEDWFLPFETGFLYYVTARDMGLAAHYFRRAARQPGCPDYVARFAAFASGRAGDVETAVGLWREIARATPNAEIARMAERRIQELLAGREEHDPS